MPTDKPYVRKDNLRACSICGVRWHFSKMRYIGQNRWACPDDAEGLTSEAIARHNARVRPLLIKQFKNPLITGNIPDYHFTEGQAFNLICKYAATANVVSGVDGAVVTTNGMLTTWFCALYLRDLIVENVRPPSWIAQAKTALAACADYMRAKQFGPAGGAGAVTIDNITWGTFSGETLQACAWGALTLGWAWDILGDQNGYRAGAIAACDALRQVCQRTDAPTTVFTTPTSNPGSRFYPGGGFADSTGYTSFGVAAAAGMWALSQMKARLGGSYVLGSTTATGGFTLVPSGTIDQALTDARAFYVDGRLTGLDYRDGATKVMAPLSSATPRSTSSISVNGSANANQWLLGQFTDSTRGFGALSFCVGLRSLFELEGYSSKVAEVYEWLMTFTQNPTTASPAGTSLEAQRNTLLGVFDVDLALPFNLAVISAGNPPTLLPAIATNASAASTSGYDIQSTGLLAPLRAASGRDLSRFKATFTKPVKSRSLKPGPGRAVSQSRPDLRGICGFSLQAFDELGVVVSNAACFGTAYRFSPKMTLTLKAG